MADSSEDELLLLDSVLPKIILGKCKRIGVHEINERRQMESGYHKLFPLLKRSPSRFQSYLRMSQETFKYILEKIEPKITKNWCNWHQQPILPEKRLVITLRFLATGSSFKTLAFNFRVGASTVALIVSETVTAIWDELQPVHMPSPTRETFRSASDDFYKLWNFPNCLGAIDGKHVRTRCPSKSGSMFYNYKRYFSIVLQAVVDAHYKFLTINVGGHGKQSDGGTFQASGLYRALVEEKLHIPEPTALPNSNVVAPFVFIADEAYPLMTHVLKPYSGTNLPLDEDCFNKRLSRCRKTVECAFGILVAKWRLLNKEIETDVLLADRIVKCVCVLHNTIIDKEDMVQNLTEVLVENQGIVWDRVGRPCNDSKTVRDVFKTYFSKYPLQYIQ